MIHHAQSQPGPVLRQKDFQTKRKQQRLESQLVTYLESQGGTVSPEQVQSEQKTAEIVQLRRDFARQALSQGYSVNEIAVALKVSSAVFATGAVRSEARRRIRRDHQFIKV
jgi:hypothetical protein